MIALSEEQIPQYHADMALAETLGRVQMRQWLDEGRSPAQISVTLMFMQALMLASIPLDDREKVIGYYQDATLSLVEHINEVRGTVSCDT